MQVLSANIYIIVHYWNIVSFLLYIWCKYFYIVSDCIGAIDGTHIPATVVGREVSRYRNRHGKISQNVLAACNFDLQFIYVLSGWEGSAHDLKVLNDAISRRNGLKVPAGIVLRAWKNAASLLNFISYTI